MKSERTFEVRVHDQWTTINQHKKHSIQCVFRSSSKWNGEQIHLLYQQLAGRFLTSIPIAISTPISISFITCMNDNNNNEMCFFSHNQRDPSISIWILVTESNWGGNIRLRIQNSNCIVKMLFIAAEWINELHYKLTKWFE